jgi:hypothetical protein
VQSAHVNLFLRHVHADDSASFRLANQSRADVRITACSRAQVQNGAFDAERKGSAAAVKANQDLFWYQREQLHTKQQVMPRTRKVPALKKRSVFSTSENAPGV